jgi:hypothetical protein
MVNANRSGVVSRIAACLGLSLVAVLISIFPSIAEPMLAIDMEGETTIVTRPAINPATHMPEQRTYLRQVDREISTTTDTGTQYSIYRSGVHYKGDFGLGFRVEREHRPADISQKSKIEINISRHDDNRLDQKYDGQYVLRNDTSHYLGFAFLMDRKLYESPTKWLLHFQVWQCCGNTQPPLALQALPQPRESEKVRFVLMKRTDAHLNNAPTSDNGERLIFLDGKSFIDLEKGKWYRLVFMVHPTPVFRENEKANIATVTLWVNGRLALQHFGPWGYTLQRSHKIQNTYAVKIGLYRSAQDTMQQFYFDTIRWGNSFASVNPDQSE